ncbi:hypothetical protein [Streptomyces sp. NPDC008150]|uniref:hypothetical protein n=1 Tax=Streptomyces sp. NPDC008150 TaxID=3364816 RepID=UPI0036E50532
MTTRSTSPHSNQPGSTLAGLASTAAPPPGAAQVTDLPPAGPADRRPAADDETDQPYRDPVDSLVHTAVAGRPLEEVVQLINLLRESPRCEEATADALRAAGIDRPVEDVTRLVALLTEPPAEPDSADAAIHAAARHRPVEEVALLLAQLHRPPLEPHCGEEAVRAAAAGRPVDELAELIGGLARDRDEGPEPSERSGPPPSPVTRDPAEEREEAAPTEPSRALDADDTRGPLPAAGHRRPRESAPPRSAAPSRPSRARERPEARDRSRPPAPAGLRPRWSGLVVCVVLVLCAAAYFPLRTDGVSTTAHVAALVASGLCLLLAVLSALRAGVVVLAAAVLVPAALAAAQLLDGRLRSPGLTAALGSTAAPSWAAGSVAALAALVALVALLVHLAPRWAVPGSPPPERAKVQASRE